jgi:uncharacterized membrane protein YkvA (DUF1232 family)
LPVNKLSNLRLKKQFDRDSAVRFFGGGFFLLTGSSRLIRLGGLLIGWHQKNMSAPAMQSLKEFARKLKKETYAIYLASKNPKVPWYARLLAAGVVAYAFSPIDLIPDMIPVIGYLDDLLIVPVGIWLVLKMIPPEVLAECREKAEAATSEGKPRNWVAAGVVIAIWVLLGILGVLWLGSILKR